MANHYLQEDATGDGRFAVNRSATYTAYTVDYYGRFLIFQPDIYAGVDDVLARKRAGVTHQHAATYAAQVMGSRWYLKKDGVDCTFLKGDPAQAFWERDHEGTGIYDPHGSPDDEYRYDVWGPIDADQSGYWWNVQMDAGSSLASSVGSSCFFNSIGAAPTTVQYGLVVDGAIHNAARTILYVDPFDFAAYRPPNKVHRYTIASPPTAYGASFILQPGPGAAPSGPDFRVDVFAETGQDVLVVHGPAGYTPWDLADSAFDEGAPLGTDTALYVLWEEVAPGAPAFRYVEFRVYPPPSFWPRLDGFRMGRLGFA